MDARKLHNVVLFTCDKRLRQLAIESLKLLEEKNKYIKSLENVLIKAGIGEYENSQVSYDKDRKKMLDCLNSALREIQGFDNLVK